MNADLAERAAATGCKRQLRVWAATEKRRMIEESCAPGALAAEVERRHGVNANLLFAFRRGVGTPIRVATHCFSWM